MTAVLTHTRFGPMLVPPFDFYLSQAMIRRGEYAPAEFDTWEPYLPTGGGVVVDVGANFGAHTFAFAKFCPLGAVFAFEPQRALYQMLCGSVELIGARNVIPRHLALGREPGHVLVPPLDYGAPGNFGGLELAAQPTGEPIPKITLDSLALPQCDFLKIDVEGMELDVLEGAVDTIARCLPVMSVEADRETQVPALIAFLHARDYRLWWHRPPLGDLWPNVVSVNLLALPLANNDLPDPDGDVESLE